METKLNSKLNLADRIPIELFNKLPSVAENELINQGKIEVSILFGQRLEETRTAVEKIGGEFNDLGYGYGIVTIEPNKIRELGAIPSILYIELPTILYTTDIQSNRASCVLPAWSNYNLTGTGVIVGFIDSGIDYTHPAFINEDGSTRIAYIYDLSDNGKVYNREDINRALKSNDPYSIVSQRDENGHGTHVVGIAAAGGKINKDFRGPAFESTIIMVKATKYGRANFALATQIMRGVKFLLDKQNELGGPLAINISLSTNEGAHNGSSLLEQYINTITRLERVAIVVAAGNEGEAGHHAGGVLKEEVEIPLGIANNERSLIMEVYKSILLFISIQVKDPTGADSGEIIIEEGFKTVKLPQCNILIYNTGPKPFDIDGEITVSLVPTTEVLVGGTWTITIRNKSKNNGRYDIWIPISESLNPNTRFLKPDIYNTLGIPATTAGVIAVGSYNSRTGNISVFSGRGREDSSCNMKPEVVSPGENILSTVPGGRLDTKTGTSMATPQVTGICALLLEWGIIKGNDGFLYGDRLKYYINLGANRNISNMEFPNPVWGYGKVCAGDSLLLLTQLIRNSNYRVSDDNSSNDYIQYTTKDLYVRIPK